MMADLKYKNKQAQRVRASISAQLPKYALEDNRSGGQELIQQKAQHNNSGLPTNLKLGIERLSGYSMDDIKVHYNSDKPAQLNAHAYAQGADIHLASGQEKHLPHEAWHSVQQKQGRVNATKQTKAGLGINDSAALENEADLMGQRALDLTRNGQAIEQHSVVKGITQKQAALNTSFQLVDNRLSTTQGDHLTVTNSRASPVVQLGRDRDNKKNKKQKTGSKGQELEEIIIGGRSLRSTDMRKTEYVTANTRQHGARPGTRTHDKALRDKKKAESEIGSGHVKISRPPTKHGEKKIYSGKRSSLSFTQETQDIVYNRVKSRQNNNRTEYKIGDQWLPRKSDRQGKEDYTSIDHNKDWAASSLWLETHEIEHEGHLWAVVYHQDALNRYNNEDSDKRENLKLMGQSANSRKSGLKGGDNLGPKYLRAIEGVDDEEGDLDNVPMLLDDKPNNNNNDYDPPSPGMDGAGSTAVF